MTPTSIDFLSTPSQSTPSQTKCDGVDITYTSNKTHDIFSIVSSIIFNFSDKYNYFMRYKLTFAYMHINIVNRSINSFILY